MKLVASVILYITLLSNTVYAGNVEWINESTGETLFTSDDIVCFDWERQLFELTHEKAVELRKACFPGKDKRTFIVRDSEGEIYKGQCIDLTSSDLYPGYTMLLAADIPYFIIQKGPYKDAADTRFSPRLKSQLEKAGKIESIEKLPNLYLILNPEERKSQ